MTRKIFKSIFLTALCALLAACALMLTILYEYYGALQRQELSTQLSFAAEGVRRDGAAYLEGLRGEECRLTWIAADGTVLFDTKNDAETMENHAQREEFIQAAESGSGESERYSATLTEQTLYRAQRLDDGTVLRASVRRMTALSLALGALQPTLVVILAVLALSGALAKRLSAKIVKPLCEMDFEQPLEGESYEELAPALTRLEKQRRQIDRQQEELQKRKKEFETIVGSMREGLILLNREGEILSMNAAAGVFLGTDEDCVGKNYLLVDRNRELGRLIEAARTEGGGEAEIERGGRVYRVNASRIDADSGDAGAALLIFDATEKVYAERNRREFTANVSHELKTPLQTIMGSAELLENGLIKGEDVPRFAGRIRTEAGRLMALIEDVIRLSQLDENAEMARERVALLTLCRSEADSLRAAAEARNISLTVQGEEITITAVKRLVHEIIYNLCDNAIKYNRDGGTVAVTVEDGGDSAQITVADNGTGIAEEDQERIFERFYRVDKSRSKQIGGTGLGLSIVKHAVEYHKGKITLESKAGEGTKIRILLPKE